MPDHHCSRMLLIIRTWVLVLVALALFSCSVASESSIDEGEELKILQRKINDELNRTLIATYAYQSAVEQASVEADKKEKANAELAKRKPAMDTARTTHSEAQKEVEQLKALLAAKREQLRNANASAREFLKLEQATEKDIAEARETARKEQARAQAFDKNYSQAEKAAEADKARRKSELRAVAALKAPVAEKHASRLSMVLDIAIAALLGVAGLYSILEPDNSFRILSVATFTALVGVTVFLGLSAFAEELGVLGHAITGAEAALVCALACWYGFDGFQLVAGAGLGLMIAYATFQFDSVLLTSAYYALAAIIGVLIMFLGGAQTQEIAGPLAGGLLFSSFITYVAALLCSSDEVGASSYFDFFMVGMSNRGAVLAFGDYALYVWLTSHLIWMVVFLLGIRKKAFGREIPGKSAPSKSRNLQEPLLGSAD